MMGELWTAEWLAGWLAGLVVKYVESLAVWLAGWLAGGHVHPVLIWAWEGAQHLHAAQQLLSTAGTRESKGWP